MDLRLDAFVVSFALVATVAAAQDEATPTDASSEPQHFGEEIVVTGSRNIRRAQPRLSTSCVRRASSHTSASRMRSVSRRPTSGEVPRPLSMRRDSSGDGRALNRSPAHRRAGGAQRGAKDGPHVLRTKTPRPTRSEGSTAAHVDVGAPRSQQLSKPRREHACAPGTGSHPAGRCRISRTSTQAPSTSMEYSGAALGACSAGREQTNRPAAARSERSRTRGGPGARRLRPGICLPHAHSSG